MRCSSPTLVQPPTATADPHQHTPNSASTSLGSPPLLCTAVAMESPDVCGGWHHLVLFPLGRPFLLLLNRTTRLHPQYQSSPPPPTILNRSFVTSSPASHPSSEPSSCYSSISQNPRPQATNQHSIHGDADVSHLWAALWSKNPLRQGSCLEGTSCRGGGTSDHRNRIGRGIQSISCHGSSR